MSVRDEPEPARRSRESMPRSHAGLSERQFDAAGVQSASRPGWPYWPEVFVGLILIGTIALRIRFLHLYLERDEGEFAYGGQLMLDGIPPYKYLYAMKLPGIYAAYAVAMRIFGETTVGVHLGLMIVNAISIVLMYRIGRRLLDPYAGVVAAASYAILSTSTGVLGFAGHATHYVVVFALAAILVLLKALDRKHWAIPELSLSGLLFGVSILMKQSGFLYAAFAAVWLLWADITPSARSPISIGRLAARAVTFCACEFLPLLCSWVLLARAGVYKRSVFWNFIYANAYAHEMIRTARTTGHAAQFLWDTFCGFFRDVCYIEPGMWIAGGIGLIVLLFSRRVPNRLFLGVFTAFAALAVAPGFWFRLHYFVQFLPALALLIGALYWSVVRLVKDEVPGHWVAGLAFAGLLAFTVTMQRDVYFHDGMIRISRLEYGYSPFPESVPIASYIRANSSPNDTIAILGSEPQIFFYAHRRSATGHIYMYPLMEEQKYAGPMQNEAVRELNASHPTFLLLETNKGAWNQTSKSVKTLATWLGREVAHYELVGIADAAENNRLRMIWGPEASSYHNANSESYVVIMKRRPENAPKKV
ncbi:MAG: ArnT family glycosyltransferase [Capsulimonadaceae bacterium]